MRFNVLPKSKYESKYHDYHTISELADIDVRSAFYLRIWKAISDKTYGC